MTAILSLRAYQNKKTEPPSSRQPGYLIKTRGFPSRPRGGFGYIWDSILRAFFMKCQRIFKKICFLKEREGPGFPFRSTWADSEGLFCLGQHGRESRAPPAWRSAH